MDILLILLQLIVLIVLVMLHVAYATYCERKVIGHIQMRLGPMRVGWHGLLQPIADGIKSFFKEDIVPVAADRPIFLAAPIICLVPAFASLAILPWAEGWAVTDVNIGLLFVFAMSSIGAYGVVLAGWASNSKYSFLGGLRASAQVISYEIAMGLSLVGVMLLSGSLNLGDIVQAQGDSFFGMFIFRQIIGFFVFCVAMLAETNRVPFDLPEAETELVSGYSTEYSGMRYALFFMAEYTSMFVMATVGTICFLGGWNGPVDLPFFPPFWLLIKVYFIMFVFFWLRATLPRYRYDQLMSLGWKVLIPLALLNIVLTAIGRAVFG